MPVIYTNNASTTLSSGINDTTTTIPIASASGFPSIGGGEYYFATIANTNNTKIEVVKVTAGTTSLTVLRAQDGTSAQAFDSGDNFQVRVTAATLSAATVSDVNITGGAIAGAAITNDVIDSQHYADGSIDTAHIGDDQVTYAKIQNVSATDRILGRDSASAGVIEEITPANLLTMLNVEAGADVTDATNVTAAGALMDSELAGLAAVKATTGTFLTADQTKLDGIETSATADQTAGEILTLIEDGVDSVHYVDGSIDLVHMSSESVDEDNLHISNAGSNGQFLAKQSGNAGGLTWTTITTEDFIPDGTVMAFWQSGAPTGWTQVTTQNDKVLRVVSGTGGGTGGDWAMSAGETSSSNGAHVHTSAAHTHTGAAHTHAGGSLAAAAHTLATSEMPAHTHGGISIDGYRSSGYTGNSGGGPLSGTSSSTGGGGTHAHSLSGTSASTTPGASGSTTPGDTGSAGAHTHTIAAPQYIDVIICSKDA